MADYQQAVSCVHACMQVMNDLVPTLQATLGEAVQPGDPRGLATVTSVCTKLQPLLAALDHRLCSLSLGSSTQQTVEWLQASAFEAYGLQVQLSDVERQLQEAVAAGGSAAASSQTPVEAAAGGMGGDGKSKPLEQEQVEATMLYVAGAVAPGSDLHLFSTLKALSRAQQVHGVESDAAKQLQARGMQVIRVRYGNDLTDGVASKLLQAACEALQKVAV